MRLSKDTIDKVKNTCYAEEKGKLQAFIVESTEGLNKERLLKALSLILLNKDVTDYFESKEHSFHPQEKDFQIRKRANL